MARYSVCLVESLTSAYPWEWGAVDSDAFGASVTAHFDIQTTGETYYVEFTSLETVPTKNAKWDVIFGPSTFQPRKIDDSVYGIRGLGAAEARRIFATVIDIIKAFVTKYRPSGLLFSAIDSEPSRVRLYARFARLAGQELPGFRFAGSHQEDDDTVFQITRADVTPPPPTASAGVPAEVF